MSKKVNTKVLSGVDEYHLRQNLPDCCSRWVATLDNCRRHLANALEELSDAKETIREHYQGK